MSITYEDIAWENAIDDLYNEAKMDRARKEQCIFLFVEGESEEIAFPILLNELIDMNELGVVVANYNGIGNLAAALRLLSKTLSHDRPIIVTYDNDIKGVTNTRKIKIPKAKSDLFHLFPIPQIEVVEYPNGHTGGSFEESFLEDDFIKCAFTENVISKEVLEKRKDFENIFRVNKPWLKQLEKFCAELGFINCEIKKTALAEELATSVKNIPGTYIKLAELIKEVRTQYPVIHPDDVDLPKIPGLTA